MEEEQEQMARSNVTVPSTNVYWNTILGLIKNVFGKTRVVAIKKLKTAKGVERVGSV